MPRNTSVTLGDHFDQFVAEILQQGRFQSVSEVVRAGLRKLEADEAKLQTLRAKLQAGEDLSLIHISEPTRQVLVSRMPSSA